VKNLGKIFGIIALFLGVISLIVSVVIGIVSLIELILTFGWIILPVIVMTLGIIGIVKDDSKGKAIGGLIFGILSLILGFMFNYLITSILALGLS